jgi:general L-amino acid transport system permease protein
MAATDVSRKSDTSILNSQAFRGLVYQLLLGAGVLLLGWYLYYNAHTNLAHQNIATGFDFLEQPAGFNIGESLIPFDSAQSYGRALVVGIINTLYVAAFGIVLATILGVVMGIARVSRNWLISTLASAYVEVCRNVPVVLHVIFWASVIRALPPPREALAPFSGVFITNRGVIYPVPVEHPVYPWIAAALGVGIVLAILFARWAARRRERTGQHVPAFWPGLAIVLGLPMAVWFAGGAPLAWSVPTLRGFNFQGGASLTPEFVALLVGITVYTGAFIAEIVRSGIQSVPHGQVEAARAVGLRPGLVMRLVVLPQALRVIVPPTTSQYLSLTKNSSLGVLIGYPDLVNVGNTTLNQTGQALEAIAIMMAVYLMISLTISVFMNVYNRFVAIRER